METLWHQLAKSKHFKLSGNCALAKQPATCSRQLLAAILQSEESDQVGRGLEHQLPQLYSHFGAIVVVQRAADEVVCVIVLGLIVVVGMVVGVVLGVVVGVVDVVVEVVEDVQLDVVEEVEEEEVEEEVKDEEVEQEVEDEEVEVGVEDEEVE